jgi:hypothetical protein
MVNLLWKKRKLWFTLSDRQQQRKKQSQCLPSGATYNAAQYG